MSKKINKNIKVLLWIGLGLLISDSIYRYGFELLAVPTSSMQNTIKAGDYVWVNKLRPGPRFYPNNANQYFRLNWGQKLAINDIIVFNFPDADTAFTEKPGESYYLLKRQSRLPDSVNTQAWGQIKILCVNKRPRMIKRIVGLPGDTVIIKEGHLWVNQQKFEEPESTIKSYEWTGDSITLLKISKQLGRDIPLHQIDVFNTTIRLSVEEARQLQNTYGPLKQFTIRPGIYDPNAFPFSAQRRWNANNMGPIVIPRKGMTMRLTPDNFALYERIINVFEEENICRIGNYLFKNNIPISKYTFKMNYYWVHGDNQPRSFDSRYWGPVPENHIVGVVQPG
ncbi:signal peptidase I [Geofilum sp. OHC36d9]|uniref:signal peptidase I n=1 Tax=Geofilum sp. OHC36d9 TaxID=3458413 RepID=UPI0040343830